MDEKFLTSFFLSKIQIIIIPNKFYLLVLFFHLRTNKELQKYAYNFGMIIYPLEVCRIFRQYTHFKIPMTMNIQNEKSKNKKNFHEKNSHIRYISKVQEI